MKFAVITFPGSNSDHDSYSAVKYGLGEPVEYVWHRDSDLSGFDCVIVPGGFSYGDYLRAGAIARFSPIMNAVSKFAADGGLVFGVCNGFQVLVESHLLPGALIRNRGIRFLGRWIYLRVENNETPFTSRYRPGEVIHVPVAHAEGNYVCAPEVLEQLEDEKRVVFRYCDSSGRLTDESNVNGSLNAIAGIINQGGNVLGMMPHPERAADPLICGSQGLKLFESMRDAIKSGATRATTAA